MSKKKYLVIGFIFLSMCIFIIPTKASETTLKNIDDAEIYSYDADDNFGSSDYLHVGAYFSLGYSESYIKFDIPETNLKVMSATIKAYWYSHSCETWLQFVACLVSNNWNEESITWNNAPIHGEIIAQDSITNAKTFTFDVTAFIVESGEFSICIYEESPHEVNGLQSASKEGEWGDAFEAPKLIIKYQLTIEDFIPTIIVGIVIVVSVEIGLVLYITLRKRKDVM